MKKVLLLLSVVTTFSFNSEHISLIEKQWSSYRNAIDIISDNSHKVLKLFDIAKSDKNLTSKNSSFDKALKKVFDEMHYTSIYDYMIDGDEKVQELIPVVFMIIMNGYEYMETSDWKNLSNPEEMEWQINRQLKKYSKPLKKEEIVFMHNQMTLYFKGDYSYKKHVEATNKMVSLVEEFTKKRGLEVLWFQNNSDSYHFFIVKPNIFKSLKDKKLMGDCSFNIPYF